MKTLIVLCGILVVVFAYPSRTNYYATHEIELTPKAYIAKYAEAFGTSYDELLFVAKCESGLRPNAVNYNDGKVGSHSYGLFQYKKDTFDRFEKLLGEDLNIDSYHDQSRLTAFIFAEYPQYKRHWSCHRKMI